MQAQKKSILAGLVGLFVLNTSYAATPNWIQAESMLSPSDGMTAITTYHDHVYIAGYDNQNLQPNNCSFVYAYQSFNNWLSVNNGLQTPTNCMQDLHTFLVFQDKLYAGGLSGFYVYSGNDYQPNWTALSVKGLPTFQPTLSNLVVFQNKIYSIATAGDGTKTAVYVYNADTQSWSNVSAMVPVQPLVSGPPTSLIVSNNKLYWLYNFVDYPPSNAFHGMIYVYNGNDAAPNWDTVFKSDDNRELLAMDIFNNTLIVAGNVNPGDSNLGQGFVLTYNNNDKLPQWNDISGFAGTLNNITISSLSHDASNLYVGGIGNTTRCASIYQYTGNFKQSSWSETDQGINRCASLGASNIMGFALTSQGLFTADFAVNNSQNLSGSVVYFNSANRKKPK